MQVIHWVRIFKFFGNYVKTSFSEVVDIETRLQYDEK